jgi:hypothetical protein
VNHFCYFSCVQVARLESQVIRYKSASETAEKVEDELKVEKRKLQREVRCFYLYFLTLQAYSELPCAVIIESL